ncbi:boophilin-H2-like [Pectinophora gossypiella]|uniref:boophilin-H2-like n=1 Tax=Pectinophora gossypiella TaxID=13191 RepID=UPI00214E0512|nr:boophilin-H2-like [Pectinophora gossypiella]
MEVVITGFFFARHRACFLRPDTGPCRAEILQWYFDAKAVKCYRFWWGGCQGNGNKFESRKECLDYCFLPSDNAPKENRKSRRPIFCSLAFDFGSCFGHYNRWYFDLFYETCRRRIYSGCGGNQNNFQTLKECVGNCLMGPNSTMGGHYQKTTCIPLDIPELQ